MSDTIIQQTLGGKVLVVETRDGPITYDSKFLVAALLIFVARGSGQIEPEETAKMLELIADHFRLAGAESLELLTRAMGEEAVRPDLVENLTELGRALSDAEKEDIALMGLKVVAADGRRQVAEMEQFQQAMSAIEVSPEALHRAFDRYFSETMTGE